MLLRSLRRLAVQVEATPNPAVLMYKSEPVVQILPKKLSKSSLSFPQENQKITGHRSVIADKLLKEDGVEAVLLGPSYVSVMGGDSSRIISLLEDHIASGDSWVDSSYAPEEPSIANTSSAVEVEIEDVLAQRVRPGVQQDGGDVEFVSFDPRDGVVHLKLHGACAGCPQSAATLKHSIENTLRFYVPVVKTVEQIIEEDTSDYPPFIRHEHHGEPAGMEKLVSLRKEVPFMSMFAGRGADDKLIKRVKFLSELTLKESHIKSTLDHVFVNCEECGAQRSLEALDSLLLDEKNPKGEACVVVCPACAVHLKVEKDGERRQTKGVQKGPKEGLI